MKLSHVHNKYRKPNIGFSELSPDSTSLSNRLLRRLEMARIALLFVIFVSFLGIAHGRTYNPTDGNVIVSLDLPEKGAYKISVFDNLGNEIFKQEINSNNNLNFEFELKSNTFPAGLYNVVVSGLSGEIISGKFIKVK
jgi:hypothetical protein